MDSEKICECDQVGTLTGDYGDFGLEFCRCSNCGLVVEDTINYTDPNHPDSI